MRRSRLSLIVNALCIAAFGGVAFTLWQRWRKNSGQDAPFTITCRVRTPDGAPAAGVPVSSIAPRSSDAYRPVTRVTDRDGICEFPDASKLSEEYAGSQMGVPFIVRTAAGCALGFVDWRRMLPQRHAEIDLRLQKTDTVSFRAVDLRGRPQAHVRAAITAAMTGPKPEFPFSYGLSAAFSDATDDAGTVSFPNVWHADRFAVAVDDARFAPQDAIVAANGPLKDRTIVLQPGCHIRGKVVFVPGGRPMAGAQVEVASIRAIAHAGRPVQTAEATADGEGRFDIPRLRPIAYAIRVGGVPGGWAAGLPAVSLAKPGETLGVTIPIQRKPLLIVRVHAESGEPIARARVAVQRTATDRSLYLTDLNGECRIDIPPGPQTVSLAKLPLGCRAGSTARPIDARPGETVSLDYPVSGLPADDLSGIVLDDAGNPVAGAAVCIGPPSFHTPGHRLVAGEWGRFDPDARWAVRGRVAMPEVVRTDEKGRFTVSREWQETPDRIWAARGATAATPAPAQIALHRNFTLMLQDRVLGAITGTVVDENGKPVAGASVALDRHYAGGLVLPSPPLATSDSHGAFEIDSLPTGVPYTLRASDSRRGCARVSADITLAPGEVRRLAAIALPAANGFVAGKVLDLHGFPVAQARVTAIGALTGVRGAVSDAQGRFRIEHVAAEPLRLSATVVPPRIESTRPMLVPGMRSSAGDAFGMGGYGLGGSPAAKPANPEEKHEVTVAAGDGDVTVPLQPD